jgi:hypothetical protein
LWLAGQRPPSGWCAWIPPMVAAFRSPDGPWSVVDASLTRPATGSVTSSPIRGARGRSKLGADFPAQQPCRRVARHRSCHHLDDPQM